MMADLGAFLDDCVRALGVGQVVTDPERTAGQAIDWSGRWRGSTPAVLRPGATDEVAAVVRSARRHGVALVPQGGNTGLVGGSVPHHGEVILDLRRLAVLGPVDVGAAQVTVGAGATLAAVQAHVAPEGLAVGVDLGARDTATIGGMVATNAGGLHVVRHGSMRSQVMGLEAVLGTGEVVSVNPAGLSKDNTGYDLAGLLCGSEGTLGIVTAVRLRLVPRPRARLVALLSLEHVDDAVRALPLLRSLADLHAVELVLAEGMQRVGEHLGRPSPLDPAAGCGLIVELADLSGSEAPAADDDGRRSRLLGALGGVLDALGPVVRDSAVAQDEGDATRLWQWREAHSEAAAGLGLVHKADVTVPLATMVAFVAAVVPTVLAVAPGAATFVYGHLGDGNLHVNVVGPAADDDRAVDAVLELVLELGGSVSAEHGIGVAKRAWVERQRGSAAVAAMRSIKGALDPDGVLNPGVLLP